MDNLCHTLVGAACGEAGLKRRTAFGSATLTIAANLPDVDVLVFATDLPSVAFRRGWTHGVLAQLVLPVVLAAAVWAIGRRRDVGTAHGANGRAPDAVPPRADFRWLLILSYVGVLSHVALDLLNNYGVRLLMPFSNRWFYGDAVFIVDPWLWLTLGAGWWLARRGTPAAARRALIIAAIYMLAMVGAARTARVLVSDAWRAASGADPASLMVGPVFLNPLRRVVIIDAGDAYVTGSFTWPAGDVVFDPQRVPKNDEDPAVMRARAESAAFRSVLVWSRFPYYVLEPAPDGTIVLLRDLRFGDRVGGVATKVSRAE